MLVQSLLLKLGGGGLRDRYWHVLLSGHLKALRREEDELRDAENKRNRLMNRWKRRSTSRGRQIST